MSSLQSYLPSRLPVMTKNKSMATRGGSRRALGDITGQQGNIVKGQGKARVTRQASRKLLALPKAMEEEPKAMEEELPNAMKEEPMEVEELARPATDRVLPEGVEDIDKRDGENPQLCSEYALEMFSYLRQLEGRGAVRADHLKGCPTNDKMRAVLVDWLVEVQLQFKLLQETLFSTVDIIDRYLAVDGATITRSRLQLVGVSAMFLAAKVEEVYAPACSDFVYITDDAFSEAEIKATEIKILRALEFDLFQPASLHFLRRFSKSSSQAGDVDVLQHSLAKFSLEVGLLEYPLVSTAGSQLAASALLLSLLLLEPESRQATVWTSSLAFYSGYTRDQLLPTVARLAGAIVRNSKNTKLQAVRTKYKGSKFLKVADLEVLKGEVIYKLAALQV